jgi:VWA domain-containing protein
MHLSFVTPAGAVVAVAGLAALAAVVAGERRLQRLRDLLGLARGSTRSSVAVGIALAAMSALLALAAAQPVVASTKNKGGRADVDVFFVLDVSRSMAARESASAATRLERAKRDAVALRGLLPHVAVGVASLNDRLLPHLFPTLSETAFDATIQRALGINQPRAALFYGSSGVGTKLGSVGDVATQGYFGNAGKRIVVVFTDGETLEEELATLPSRLERKHVRAFFVRYWSRQDRIFLPDGGIEASYAPDTGSGAVLDGLARSLRTRVFAGGDVRGILATLRGAIGHGPSATRERDLGSTQLAPYLVALAFPFLAFVLLKRHAPDVFRDRLRRGKTAA